jgi:hypothetical protein
VTKRHWRALETTQFAGLVKRVPAAVCYGTGTAKRIEPFHAVAFGSSGEADERMAELITMLAVAGEVLAALAVS